MQNFLKFYLTKYVGDGIMENSATHAESVRGPPAILAQIWGFVNRQFAQKKEVAYATSASLASTSLRFF